MLLRVLESLVKLRNEKIDRSIHQKYEQINRNAQTLAVHFVSSCDYESHLGVYASSHVPLSFETTGIPKLRCALSSLSAEDRLMVLDHHYKGKLRNVLDNLAIWTSQTPFERHQQLRRIVETPQMVRHSVR